MRSEVGKSTKPSPPKQAKDQETTDVDPKKGKDLETTNVDTKKRKKAKELETTATPSPKRWRLRTKSSPQTPAPTGPKRKNDGKGAQKKPKKTPKVRKDATEELAQPESKPAPPSLEDIVFPLKMEHRRPTETRFGEAYILRNTEKDRYVAGQSQHLTEHYLDNVDLLKSKLEAKEIVTRTEAREFLLNCID